MHARAYQAARLQTRRPSKPEAEARTAEWNRQYLAKDKTPQYSDDELVSQNKSLANLYNARARYVERARPSQSVPLTLPSAPVVQAPQGSWNDWQSRQLAPPRSQRTTLYFLAAFVFIVVALIALPSTFVSVLCFSVAALAIIIGTITLFSR